MSPTALLRSLSRAARSQHPRVDKTHARCNHASFLPSNPKIATDVCHSQETEQSAVGTPLVPATERQGTAARGGTCTNNPAEPSLSTARETLPLAAVRTNPSALLRAGKQRPPRGAATDQCASSCPPEARHRCGTAGGGQAGCEGGYATHACQQPGTQITTSGPPLADPHERSTRHAPGRADTTRHGLHVPLRPVQACCLRWCCGDLTCVHTTW